MSAINGFGASGAGMLRQAGPAAETLDAGAPLDPARAKQLREAVAAGHYPVDADRLAERLIALGLFPAQAK